MTSPYAWIIDTDHLASSDGNEAGVAGPRTAPCGDLAKHYEHSHQFRMYDDDGELYYTGTLYWNGDSEPADEYCDAPLRDYGTPNAGCIEIRYTGRPEWDCG